MSDDDAARTAQQAARLAVASLGFAAPVEWWSQALLDWVGAMEPVADLTGFDVVADLDLRRLRWRVGGPVGTVAPRAVAWFEQLGLDGGERSASVARSAGSDHVGCWVDVSADLLLSGWDVELGDAAGLDAFDALPDTRSVRRLWSWCDGNDVAALDRLGMVAGSDGDVDVSFALPGRSIDLQMVAALKVFDEFGIDPPADELLGAIGAIGRPRLSLRCSLTPDGVAWMSVATTEPSNDLVLTAISTSGLGDDLDLAAFEGALGVVDRGWLEVVQAPEPTVRVGYRLA